MKKCVVEGFQAAVKFAISEGVCLYKSFSIRLRLRKGDRRIDLLE
jgi:hypothetical protein